MATTSDKPKEMPTLHLAKLEEAMRPEELYAAFADLLTRVCVRLYRAEPVTAAEYDMLTDAFLLLAKREKEKMQ